MELPKYGIDESGLWPGTFYLLQSESHSEKWFKIEGDQVVDLKGNFTREERRFIKEYFGL